MFFGEVMMLNKELLSTLFSLFFGCVIIMGLIVIACLVTPKIARWLEKKYPQLKDTPERVEGDLQGADPKDVKVQGLFDRSQLEDFDPNYKIYNTDIYGVDFKHVKKQKRKDG